MTALENWFSRWVVHYRWMIVIVALLAVAAISLGARNLYFTTDYRVFFGPDNPERKAFESLENIYSKRDNVMIILAPDQGTVFSPTVLGLVEALTERAWQIPYSNRVDSLSNFQFTSADGDDLLVRDLVRGATTLSQSELGAIRDIALNEPLLAGQLVSPDGRVTAINVSLQMPGLSTSSETPQVVRFTRALADEVREQYPGVSVYLTGVAMMNHAFTESTKSDLETLVPLSFALMTLVLVIALGNVVGAIATVLVIGLSVTVALGGGGFAGFPITPPSAAAPTIILTVALASCTHILVTFLHHLRLGLTRHGAVTESLRVNLQPVFLAALTTACGFAALNFSEVPPFRHLGSLVAMGVGAAFVLSVTFLPALISILPIHAKVSPQVGVTRLDRIADFVVEYRNGLLWGMGMLVVVLVLFIPRNELNDIFVHYFDESVDFRADTDFMAANLTGPTQIEYSIAAATAGGVSEPAFLAELSTFADWLRSQPETLHVTVLTDVLKRLNKNMHADDPSEYRLPQSRELAAQYLLLYEMSLPFGLDLNNQINLDKSATRVSISNRIMSTNEILAFDDRVFEWLSRNARHMVPTRGSGGPLMFAHIGHRNIITMLVGTTLALVAISLMLVIALRSVKVGLLSMVPNLVPAALGFGLWGMFDGQIGLSLSVVTTMTLGIVVDDTVHFLSKYLRGRREKGLSPADAVRYAFHTVGRALVITTVVLVAGFSVLATSSFELNSGMGLLTAVVIALALLADFFFLPPLLMKLEGQEDVPVVAGATTDSAPA
jgi:predicted RND superfamily exporter protein